MDSRKKIVIALVRNSLGEVLIARRAKEEVGSDGSTIRWVFPGGKIERGETLEAAAERETLEESGYKVRARQLITDAPHPQFPVHIYYFDCQLVASQPISEPASDIQEYRWVKPAELDNYFTTHLDDVIREFLKLVPDLADDGLPQSKDS